MGSYNAVAYYPGEYGPVRRSRKGATALAMGVILLVAGIVAVPVYQYLFDLQQASRPLHPGGAAKDFLSEDRYTKMIIEMDYASAYPPNSDSLVRFRLQVEQYVDKSDVTLLVDDPISMTGGATCVEDISGYEEQHRDYVTGNGTAALYVVYVSGQCPGDGDVAGVTYSGSAFAVYKETIYDNIPTSNPDYVNLRRNAEANVLVHEFGHVIGLVNELGFESRYEHEDPSNPYHSKYQNSVMYYSASMDGYQTFDSYDAADINDLKSAPYPAPDRLVNLFFWALIVAGIVLVIVGGALAAVEKRRESRRVARAATPATVMAQQPETPWPQQQPENPPSLQQQAPPAAQYCPTCGSPLYYVAPYQRWYCYTCGRYL